MKFIQLLGLLLSLFILSNCSKEVNSLTSPDGKIELIVKTSPLNSDKLLYSVLLDKDTIVEKSSLGLCLDSLKSNYQYLHKKIIKKNKEVNVASYFFLMNHLDTLEIKFKVFNDGVAYQYILPNSKDKVITKEDTSFNLPDGNVWIQPYDKVTQWSPGYEQPYIETFSGASSPNSEGWCFPILFESKDKQKWMLISESNLDGNYPAMHLEQEAQKGNYKLRMPEKEEAYNLVDIIKIPKKWSSPWRFITITKSIKDLFKSDMVNRLSDAPNKDYSWVKPGRSSWSWWSDHDSSQDPKKLRKFIDLAESFNWEYSLIDANWDKFPEDTLKSLIDYAEKRNVGIWLWYNSGGTNNTVTEAPRNKMHIDSIRKKEFLKLKEWGVKGVKIDFFQSDKTPIIQQYLDIIKDAADNKIMLNFHGCTLPRGWSKTYPHVLTMEAVRGAEAYSFNKEWANIAATQHTIYAVSRNLIGPVDYTPVTFSKYPNGRETTIAHELALPVILTSSIQHFADSAESYNNQSKFIKKYLKNIPSVWDESELLMGYPGEFMVIARRKGKFWYIAGINGSDKERNLDIDISKFKVKKGELYADFKASINFEEITEEKSLSVKMQPFGGFVYIAKQ